MNKKEWFELMEHYRNVDYHCKPTLGIDSGAGGKCAEMLVNTYFENFRGYSVKRAGVTDCKIYRRDNDGNKHCTTIEIKTGNGTVSKKVPKRENPDLKSRSYFKTDFVVYVPFFFPDVPIEKQAFVMFRDDWNDLVNDVHGLRIAKDREGRKKVMFTSNFSEKFLRAIDNFYYITLDKI